MSEFRIALAQTNPTVGDLQRNCARMIAIIRDAKRAKVDLVAFPELALTGYPPEDLVLKPTFLEETRAALSEFVGQSMGMALVVGYVCQGRELGPGKNRRTVVPAGRDELFNAAAVIAHKTIVATYLKMCLPNYGVFDERRYFSPGKKPLIFSHRGVWMGLNICEDIWQPDGPTRAQAAAGADVIVNINASPFYNGKSRVREQMLGTRARDNGVIVASTNMVGGQDELVFDGNSVIVDQNGEVIARGKSFEEDVLIADLNVRAVARGRLAPSRTRWFPRGLGSMVERVNIRACPPHGTRTRVHANRPELPSSLEETYAALVLGLRDYVKKNTFTKVIIGVSGGVDSALTSAIAVDALGASKVVGVFMPSPYTSRESREDVVDLARRQGIQVLTVPITRIFQVYRTSLAACLKGKQLGVTEENVQARIRGNIVMALSNSYGYLVVTTGNKSEMSVGYATLYGDMAGGFAPLHDVPKTMVYDLARLRNGRGGEAVIPKRILDKAPTAELRPNQKDEDFLPPYPLLDPILQAYVEEDRSVEEIVAMGFDQDTVSKVMTMVDRSEYKRRQAPIGIKITHRAFGKDRRMPITNRFGEGKGM